ncbi:type II secretion system protein [Shewanella sp. 10N.261.52.F9]|uniref:type II secretion system protein n=1 Tax=Shewanella sp. 10N.261.52.F9 TaxID=3229684 RepID=UPI00354DDB67
MQKQNGFTLIELVVVIIILGILAVTAAPKFINLQSDARASTLQGVKGAIQGANSLVFSKAAIQGEEGELAGTVILDDKGTSAAGDDVTVSSVYGFLKNAKADIIVAVDVDTESTNPEWVIEDSPSVQTTLTDAIVVYPANFTPSDTAKCWVEYLEPQAKGGLPQYNVEDSGC